MSFKAGTEVMMTGTILRDCHGIVSEGRVKYIGWRSYQKIKLTVGNNNVKPGQYWDVFCKDMMPITGKDKLEPNLAFRIKRGK